NYKIGAIHALLIFWYKNLYVSGVNWLLHTAAAIGGRAQGGDYARAALYSASRVCWSERSGGFYPPDLPAPGLGRARFHCRGSPVTPVVWGTGPRPYYDGWVFVVHRIGSVYGGIVVGGEMGPFRSLSADAVCRTGAVCGSRSSDFLAAALHCHLRQLPECHSDRRHCDCPLVRGVDLYCLHDAPGFFLPGQYPVAWWVCGTRRHHREHAVRLEPRGVLRWAHGGVCWRRHPLQHLKYLAPVSSRSARGSSSGPVRFRSPHVLV